MAPTRSSTPPDFLTSPSVGELVALALEDYAEQRERASGEAGTSRLDAVLIRTYRRAAVQINAQHVDAE